MSSFLGSPNCIRVLLKRISTEQTHVPLPTCLHKLGTELATKALKMDSPLEAAAALFLRPDSLLVHFRSYHVQLWQHH